MGERGGREKEREREEEEEEEKGHTINKLCIFVFITGFKFIMFDHILFHLT